MRLLVQRVNKASVEVNSKCVGKINNGLLVFIGVSNLDTKKEADYLVKKLLNLRIFRDEQDKMNLSVKDIAGELLIVSQFTLYADTSHGNRPSFVNSGRPELANELYQYFIEQCRNNNINVQTGIFGAKMSVNLINDGPVTILLEKEP